MLIKERKIVTIHNPRTGMTALENILCKPHTSLEVERRFDYGSKHLDLDRALNLWKDKIDDSWLMIGVVRDPVDLVATQWFQHYYPNPDVPKTLSAFQEYVDRLDSESILYPTSAEVDDHLPKKSKMQMSAGTTQCRFFESPTSNPTSLILLPFEYLCCLLPGRKSFRTMEERYLLPVQYRHWYRDQDQMARVKELAMEDVQLHNRVRQSHPQLEWIV